MVSTIQKWGNSQGVRLPKIMLDELNMAEGCDVEITKHDGMIVIKALAKGRKSIQELFDGYEGGYTPLDVDWGEPSEIW